MAAMLVAAKLRATEIDAESVETDTLTAIMATIVQASIDKINAGTIATDELETALATIAAAQINTVNIKNANIDWAEIATLTTQIATIAKAQITTANIKNANIQWAEIADLTAKMAEIADAKIDDAEITTAQIKDLEATLADIVTAKIGTADIGFAQIKDLTAGTAIITEGVGGKLYISRLAVTEANMVSLTVGELIVKGSDGSFYAVSVDENGDVQTTLKQIGNTDVKDLSINAGEKIIEGSITAACLNAEDIFADNAIIRQLIAANMDVGTLFANDAFISHLNTADISGNEYLKLAVKNAVDAVAVGGRNLALASGTEKSNAISATAAMGAYYALSDYGKSVLDAADVDCTISFEAKSSVAGAEIRASLRGESSSTIVSNVAASAVLSTAYKRYSYTVQTTAGGAARMWFLQPASTLTGTIYVRNIKVELGNVATDWSPAPEDAESEIGSLKTRVSEAETKITPTAIVSTVTSSESYQTLSSTANTAKSTADTAKSNAATAQSTADTAKANAATAQSTANSAKSKADANESDITALTTRVSQAEVKITPTAIAATVKENYVADKVHVDSSYSKVEINKDRVRIVSTQMEVAVPSEDGEDDVMRVDADGVHAEVVEADMVLSDSVVSTQGDASYTPADAGALAEILEELSGKYLLGVLSIDCKNVSSGSFEVQNVHGPGRIRLLNGTMNGLKIANCDCYVYCYSATFSTAETGAVVDNSERVYFSTCTFNAGVGIQLGSVWRARARMHACTGTCTVLAKLTLCSELDLSGSKPTGTLNLEKGSQVYNATSDPNFTAPSSGSVPTTQVATVSLSPTSTSTSGHSGLGSKLYQGRYSSSQSFRKGVMLFTLPSDLTSAANIESATLTIKRIAGVGGGGSVVAQIRCYDQTGTLYASKSVKNGQTVSIDVTSAVKAMKTNSYTGLMLYNPATSTVGDKTYTTGYARFAGKGESGAPVLKVTYKK